MYPPVFSKERLPFSIAYLSSLGLTLYFSLGVRTSRSHIELHVSLTLFLTECFLLWGHYLRCHPNHVPCLLRCSLFPGRRPDPQVWCTNGDAWSRKSLAHLSASSHAAPLDTSHGLLYRYSCRLTICKVEVCYIVHLRH